MCGIFTILNYSNTDTDMIKDEFEYECELLLLNKLRASRPFFLFDK